MLFFYILQSLSVFLPLLFFFIFKRHDKERIVRVIFYYIIYCIAQEFLTFLFSFIIIGFKEVVYFLFASYTIIEFLIFALFYSYLFPKGHFIKKVLAFLFPLFILLGLFDFVLINNFKNFDSITIGVESLLLLFLCGYYLYYQVTTSMTLFVYKTYNFWIIVTFLIYVSSTFFLYIMTDTMKNNPEFQIYYVLINSGANILKNLLLCFALTRRHILTAGPATQRESKFNLDLGDDFVLQQNIQI